MSASSKVFSNSTLMGCISSFLPLTDLSNVCRTNSSLCAHTKTKAAAEQTFGYMLRTVNNPDMAAFERFSRGRLNKEQSPLALIRQMPSIRHLTIATSLGRFFLIGLNNMKHTYELQSLDITYSGSSQANDPLDENSIKFDDLANYQKLQTLRLCCGAIDNFTIEPLTRIPSLRELGLFGCNALGTQGIGNLLKKLPFLHSLSICYRFEKGSFVRHAAEAIQKHGKNLVSLTLKHNGDNPANIVEMVKACPQLTFLDVAEADFVRHREFFRHEDHAVWREFLRDVEKSRPSLEIRYSKNQLKKV